MGTSEPTAQGIGPTGQFEIRPYRADDLREIVKLLRTAFGEWPGRDVDCADPEEFFRWKHMSNPFGSSRLMVAETAGRVIGVACWMPWRFRANGQRIPALRGTDVAAHPTYQRHGVHTSFLREQRAHRPDEHAFVLSEPNARSRPQSRAAGGHDLGTLALFVRPHTGLLGGVRLVTGRLHRDPSALPPPVEAEKAEEALLDGDGVHGLLAEIEESRGLLVTDRDVEYLRWKYAALPVYRAARWYRGGRLAGMAIFRVWRRRSAWASVICELLVAPGDYQAARRLLQGVTSAARTDCVIGHFPPGTAARRAALRGGFIPTRRGPQPILRLMRGGVLPDPTRPSSWGLTLGDFDLV